MGFTRREEVGPNFQKGPYYFLGEPTDCLTKLEQYHSRLIYLRNNLFEPLQRKIHDQALKRNLDRVAGEMFAEFLQIFETLPPCPS